jgi:hypothetical protein
MTMEPRDVRRRIRRAFHVKRWSLHTKIAVGAWIPVVVVALALMTGPSRPAPTKSAAAATSPTSAPTKFRLADLTPYKMPKTVPVDVAVGAWLKGVRAKGLPVYARMARQNRVSRLLTKHPGAGLGGRGR